MGSTPRIFTVLELSVPDGEAMPKVRKAILAAGLKLSEFSTNEDIVGVALESIPNTNRFSDWEYRDADLIDHKRYGSCYVGIFLSKGSVALVHDLGQTATIYDIHQSEGELLEILLRMRRADASISGKITFQADEA